MTLIGVGGNGSVVSLVLTGESAQLAKELEPLDAIHLAHRLIEEALAIRRHEAAIRPKRRPSGHVEAVSYTHLTLPTNREV